MDFEILYDDSDAEEERREREEQQQSHHSSSLFPHPTAASQQPSPASKPPGATRCERTQLHIITDSNDSSQNQRNETKRDSGMVMVYIALCLGIAVCLAGSLSLYKVLNGPSARENWDRLEDLQAR